MKISFIATVYNEEKTIEALLRSIANQSVLPDEVIIVDGGSSDVTASIISNFKFPISNKPIKLKVIIKKGNRAVGRNEAIKNAYGNIIVCSDAGCILDKNWVQNITAPFLLKNVDVVAGYYAAKPKSLFQKCVVPYVLVMPDKVDPNTFLPASRSMAFKKNVWEKTGGFPEKYYHNEDYVWAQKLRREKFSIVFARNAIVFWEPRKNLKAAFVMFYRFALGDTEAGIFRPKVIFLFARYFFYFFLLCLYFIFQLYAIRYLLYALLVLYLAWSVKKNYRYIKHPGAIFILPILQVTSDIAILTGSSMGTVQRFLGGGYSIDAIKGVSWVGALRFSTRIVSFIRTAVLARILDPGQFGAYGVAMLVLALLEVFTETGVNVLLIQEKEKKDEYIHSAWIVSIVRGCIISFGLYISAPYVAAFFHSPQSVPLLQVISIAPLLRGFINPSVAYFQKELQFQKEFWYRFVLFFVDGSVAIGFAFITHSAISLVIGFIAGIILELALSFIIVKPRPRLMIKADYIKQIIHRGKWITASGIFNYLFHNADNIVVGRLLGTTSLGLYEMAYSISILPITEVGDVFSRVTFPVYAKIADDRMRLKTAFVKSTLVVSLLTIPFGIILFFFPKEIIHVVLGDKWLGMAVVLPILAVFGVLRAISGFASALFLAVGKQEYVTVVTLASFLGLIIPIVPLVIQYGMLGAGISAMIGTLVAIPLFVYYTISVLKDDSGQRPE